MNFYELLSKMKELDQPTNERATGGRPGINSLTGEPAAPAAPEPDHLAEPPERAPMAPGAPNILANKTRMPNPAAAARAQRSAAANDLANQQQPQEGNAFSGALDAARDSGKSEFEVDGKQYKVHEDGSVEECGMSPMMPPPAPKQQDNVNMNVSLNASGSGGIKDLMNILRNIEQGDGHSHGGDMDPPAPFNGRDDGEIMIKKLPGFDDMMSSETFANEPDEMYGDMSTAIRDGGDLNRAKRSFARAQPGDNPMAVESIKNNLFALYEQIKNR